MQRLRCWLGFHYYLYYLVDGKQFRECLRCGEAEMYLNPFAYAIVTFEERL